MGRPVPIRAGVGASIPAGAGVCACGRTGGFPLAPSPLRAVVGEKPHGYKYSGRKAGGFPLAPCTPSGSQRANGEKLCACGRTKGLSSGQTIGAARTAVRPACCLPELRVANRLRRLYPLDDGELFKFNLKSSVCQRQTGLPKGNPPYVFPSFPFGNLRIAPRSNQAPHRAASPSPAPESARQALPTYLNAFGTHSSEG